MQKVPTLSSHRSREYSKMDRSKRKMAALDVDSMNCKWNISKALKDGEKESETPIICESRYLKANFEIVSLKSLVEELHRVFSSDYVNVDYVSQVMMNYKSNPSDWRKYAKFDRFRYTRNLVDAGNGAFNIMVLCWGGGHASAIHDHADSHCFMKILSGQLEEVRYSWPDENRSPYNNRLQDCICFKSDEVISDNLKSMSLCDDDETSSNKSDSTSGESSGSGSEEEVCRCGARSGSRIVSPCRYQDTADEGVEVSSMVETGRCKLELNDVCYINDTLGLHRVENPSHVDGAVSLHLYCPPFDSCKVFDARTGKASNANVTFWSIYGSRRNREIQDKRAPEDN